MRKVKQLFSIVFVAMLFVLLISCKKTKYLVVFETDGGSKIQNVEVSKGKLVPEPSTPLKEGYQFDDWYLDEAKTKKFNFKTEKIKADTTIYANWQIKTFQITFDTDGGSEVEMVEVEYQGLLSKPVNPTKEGYAFVGWYHDSEKEYQWDFLVDKVSEDLTIYAKWDANSVVVKFEPNNGDESEEVLVKYGNLVAEPETEPLKKGHDFIGWFSGTEEEVLWDFATDVVKEELTIYAKWQIHQFEVNFKANGGTEVASQTIDYNNLIIEPDEPTRDAYLFIGWYIDEEKTIPWDFNNSRVTKNVTLYAKWEEESVPVITAKDLKIRLEEFADLDLLAGVIALDNHDGDLTANLIVDDSLVLAEVGSYDVVYTVENSLGHKVSKTIVLTIEAATKVLPELDNREFIVKTQNLNRNVDDMIEADFSVDEIVYNVYNFDAANNQHGNIQIERKIINIIKKNTNYVLAFTVKASKEGVIQPYLQKDPVASPYTNIMGNSAKEVGEEEKRIEINFTTEDVVDSDYSLSIEFGLLFSKNESGFIIFKDFVLYEAQIVDFNSLGGSSVESQYLRSGDLIVEPTNPTKPGYQFIGWFLDEELTTEWDFETDLLETAMVLYAGWEGLSKPEISGYQDLTIRLNELEGYDYLKNITVADSVDGDITDNLTVDDSLVLPELGSYQVTYFVENSLGHQDEVTITVTILEATKSLPNLDNRDFRVKTQNLVGEIEKMLDVTLGYQEIIFKVTDYNTTMFHSSSLQLERVLTNVVEANKTYTLSFYAEGTKEGYITPYLQKDPVDYPYTNIMGNGKILVTKEGSLIEITFKTGAEVESAYSLSIEFGDYIENGESVSLTFSDFKLEETIFVQFNSNGGTNVSPVGVVEGGLLRAPKAPTREAFNFVGWYKDEEVVEAWDFEVDTVLEEITLYAKWEPQEIPVIKGYRDLKVRLNELDGFDYLEGITALDGNDGDLTSSIIVDTSNVLEEEGSYEIIYSVSNSLGHQEVVRITLIVEKATKLLPELDTRDFHVKTQNLVGDIEEMLDVAIGYDEIYYQVNNYQYNGSTQQGNLQVEYILEGALKANTTYTFSFVVKASTEGFIKPYLQKMPVASPWTNLFGKDNEEQAVSLEEKTIEITFTTDGNVSGDYSLSIEFAQLFENAEDRSGFIIYKDFQLIEVVE
ncbi:MAG: InlB B-repeat-containing protein [Acholeplasmataceae bacterium]|nr:InlB B-repeat-containing protein [Acholeplasmataceae bacterium]MCK9427995.1 InlB B-repeat-containing protein [Acholeplasmataceae bacterium]